MIIIENGKAIEISKIWAVYQVLWKGGYGTEVRKIFKDYIRHNCIGLPEDRADAKIYTDKEKATLECSRWNSGRIEYEKERRAAYDEYHTRFIVHECNLDGSIKLSPAEKKLIGTPDELLGHYNYKMDLEYCGR